jgi:nascent polypeptide-associated complex subunit beta
MAETNPDILAARQKLAAKFGGGQVGGKGTARRKVKAKHTTSNGATDDKKLQTQMKKLGVNPIPGIEEVNMFTEDNNVIHFKEPKVQASLTANTYVISGQNETKPLQEMLPQVIQQLGMENMMSLQNMLQKDGGALGAAAKAAAAGKEDDDIPDLVEDFEAASKA